MLLLRKIDYSAQIVFGVLMLLSIPLVFIYGFLAGLFLLGGWQLISAALNTTCFLKNSLVTDICMYWKCTGLVFACFFLCVPLVEIFDEDDVQVLGGAGLIASIPLAVYYLHIYGKLLGNLRLRNELSSLIKSNHY
jgi:hypothetical protein